MSRLALAFLLTGCAAAGGHHDTPPRVRPPVRAIAPAAASLPPTASPPPWTPGPVPVTRPVPAPARLIPPVRLTADETRTVESTAYCETGTMKSGRRTYDGAAAVPRSQYRALVGSRWLILSGPYAGRTVTVEDQIGHSSEFDIAMPGDCAAARTYGRRRIQIRRAA